MGTPQTHRAEPYLTGLRKLPFVRQADLVEGGHPEADYALVLRTRKGTHKYDVQEARTHLTRELVDHLATRFNVQRTKKARPWMLFAPYVGAGMAEQLARLDIQYVDRAGNCRVQIGDEYMALIEGQRQPKELNQPHKGTGTRPEGYQVLFTLLARPELANAPVRAIAQAAGPGKTAVAELLRRLEDEGLLTDTKGHRHLLVERGELLQRWIAGYTNVLRPRLFMGRYRTQDADPQQLERHVEQALGATVPWAWGGTAAAARLVGHYRGQQTVLHVDDTLLEMELRRRLRALPAEDGPLVVVRAPAQAAFDGKRPRTVHPLLVYAELLATNDERAREEAQLIYKRYLK